MKSESRTANIFAVSCVWKYACLVCPVACVDQTGDHFRPHS